MLLNVSALMKIDGRLSVNGQPGTYQSGGGSGGSLYFVAGHFDGSGVIQVSLLGLSFSVTVKSEV